jgi:hypothetical protein
VKPIDITGLSPAVYGDLVQPECATHAVPRRPPNRIGYARSRRPAAVRDAASKNRDRAG